MFGPHENVFPGPAVALEGPAYGTSCRLSIMPSRHLPVTDVLWVGRK